MEFSDENADRTHSYSSKRVSEAVVSTLARTSLIKTSHCSAEMFRFSAILREVSDNGGGNHLPPKYPLDAFLYSRRDTPPTFIQNPPGICQERPLRLCPLGLQLDLSICQNRRGDIWG